MMLLTFGSGRHALQNIDIAVIDFASLQLDSSAFFSTDGIGRRFTGKIGRYTGPAVVREMIGLQLAVHALGSSRDVIIVIIFMRCIYASAFEVSREFEG